MYLDDVRAAQKRGQALGIPSVCSAQVDVLRECLRQSQLYKLPALIESTCNQVNQFGGYTGLTPAEFAAQIRGLAVELGIPLDSFVLGGDHLGPSVWRDEPAGSAMSKAAGLVRGYVQAGYTKIHLDCSMRLADDQPGGPSPQTIAERAARLAQVAEQASRGELRYVIGTEVPPPGGAAANSGELAVTSVADASEAIELHRRAFAAAGAARAWERVIALVMQPGVEFGDEFVAEYRPERAKELSRFIESQSLVYEAHSTDYQDTHALKAMVHDHFAILKVGPALTYAYREAIFALASMENELVPADERSNVLEVIEQAMLRKPKYWENYYGGSEEEKQFRRRYSLSDRIRYYWPEAEVQEALGRLRRNLSARPVPQTLIDQYAPQEKSALTTRGVAFTFEAVIAGRIARRLRDYFEACKPGE